MSAQRVQANVGPGVRIQHANSSFENQPNNSVITNAESLKQMEKTNPEEYRKYMRVKHLAEELHSEGYKARQQGNYEIAVRRYTEALTIMPNHFKALFNRGFAYDKLECYDLAIEDYTAAIAIDHKNAFTFYNKGISLDRKGDYDQAIECFSRAIEIEPHKADFYHNRGFAFRKKKSYQRAI